MKICLGSKNPVKLKAAELISQNFFSDTKVEISAFKADSLVPDQPIGLFETITGAVNRAKGAFASGSFDFGMGIESGITKDPVDNSYYNMTVCALFNGEKIFKGLGPGFKLPDHVSKLLVNEKMELDEAVLKTGFTKNKRIGYSEGIIGILSNGLVTRMDYTKPAVEMAFIACINEI